MKTYRAQRHSHVVMVHVGDAQFALRPRLDLRNYLTTGYEWGKISRACYQLALGLLADALEDDERALMLHRAYAEEYIAKLNRDAGIMLTADTIRLDARLMESRATA